ncbi:MAG: hypothetical protein V1755_14490 [Chloroflexota bacterium]
MTAHWERRARRAERQVARWSQHVRRTVDAVELPEYVLGADLRYQGEIDVAKCRAQGIRVFIVKWGQGTGEAKTADAYTETVIDGGGLLGYYHWPTIGSPPSRYSAVADADGEWGAYRDGVESYRAPDLPLGFDLEATYFERHGGADHDPTLAERAIARQFMRQYVGQISAWNQHVLGRPEVLGYFSARKLDQILGEFDEDSAFWQWFVPLVDPWLPRYYESGPSSHDLVPDFAHPPKHPEQYTRLGRTEYMMWQFTSTAIVDGIGEEADVEVVRTSWLRRYVPAGEIA